MTEAALQEARLKHPHFCGTFCGLADWARAAQQDLGFLRACNDAEEGSGSHSALGILLEEVRESEAAYRQGDLTGCLHELAQCGAVILRMMQYVNRLKEA